MQTRERAHCARSVFPFIKKKKKNVIKVELKKKRNRKKIQVIIKGIVLNVVRCVSKEDVLEYARIFSVIVGIEKEV